MGTGKQQVVTVYVSKCIRICRFLCNQLNVCLFKLSAPLQIKSSVIAKEWRIKNVSNNVI
jgi:hypothetical protein